MSDSDHVVMALDDEPKVLDSVQRLLTGRGFCVRVHDNSESMFEAGPPAVPSCLLLDHQLGNGVTGLNVQAEMQSRGWEMPIVFLTGDWSARSIVSAMRAGAFGFLTKPYAPDELVQEVGRALAHARDTHESGAERAELRARTASLTPHERAIVAQVTAGYLNKEIADNLKLALVTVKVYRGSAMKKLGAGNAAELARLAALAGIDYSMREEASSALHGA
jgi:FixJ family two-component response regulator